MKETLKAGLKVDFTYRVSAERTVPLLLPESPEFGAMPGVLATGYMVALFEWACIVAVNPHLDWPEEQTVGTHVNLSHVAATPPGLTLHIEGELVAIDGRKLTFHLKADDGVDLISEGSHERFIINRSKFDRKLKEKSQIPSRQPGDTGRGQPSLPTGGSNSLDRSLSDGCRQCKGKSCTNQVAIAPGSAVLTWSRFL